MKQDDRWELHCQEIMNFVKERRRIPSKHYSEDHSMLNWMKYNKRLLRNGTMPAARLARFRELLALADNYRKINQYAYIRPQQQQGVLSFDASKKNDAGAIPPTQDTAPADPQT